MKESFNVFKILIEHIILKERMLSHKYLATYLQKMWWEISQLHNSIQKGTFGIC